LEFTLFALEIKKDELLAALSAASGAIDKKNALPILSNFLLKINNNQLVITATDLEIEISASVACTTDIKGDSVTVPAKKFIDVIRSLDDDVVPKLSSEGSSFSITHGSTSFRLTTLPADHFPLAEDECNQVELTIPRLALLNLLQSTHFAMAQQDVRTFLNGLFLEFEPKLLTAVATDGHRMAVSRYECENPSHVGLLMPKKGVLELLKLLNSIDEETIVLATGKNQIKLVTKNFTFSSKLIEARFPPYAKAIPRIQDKQIVIDSSVLKRSLTRIAILAHEKSKAVMLHIQNGQLTLIANNNDHEEAVETLPAQTTGEELKIGLNATYLLDVLNHFSSEPIKLSFANTDTSILIEPLEHSLYQYIIMPMKI
jgi:DNA polymerase-3 subunit beta